MRKKLKTTKETIIVVDELALYVLKATDKVVGFIERTNLILL